MFLHSQMLYEYHKVRPYHTFLKIRFSKTDSDALFKLAELFLCTEEIIVNRVSGGSQGKRKDE